MINPWAPPSLHLLSFQIAPLTQQNLFARQQKNLTESKERPPLFKRCAVFILSDVSQKPTIFPIRKINTSGMNVRSPSLYTSAIFSSFIFVGGFFEAAAAVCGEVLDSLDRKVISWKYTESWYTQISCEFFKRKMGKLCISSQNVQNQFKKQF